MSISPTGVVVAITRDAATQHDVVEFVRTMTLRAQYYRVRPSAERLARCAADIRALTPGKVGPMPPEVQAFITKFGGDGPAAPAK